MQFINIGYVRYLAIKFVMYRSCQMGYSYPIESEVTRDLYWR